MARFDEPKKNASRLALVTARQPAPLLQRYGELNVLESNVAPAAAPGRKAGASCPANLGQQLLERVVSCVIAPTHASGAAPQQASRDKIFYRRRVIQPGVLNRTMLQYNHR